MMKKTIILICNIFIGFIILTACMPFSKDERIISQNDSKLSFHIDLPKKIFRLNQPIYLSMTLMNRTDEMMVVKRRLVPKNDFYAEQDIYDIVLEVKGPNGQIDTAEVNTFMQIDILSEDDFLLLYPDQSFSSQLKNIETLYSINRVGFYRVRGKYQNEQGFSEMTWKGVIVSNQEWFIVIP